MAEEQDNTSPRQLWEQPGLKARAGRDPGTGGAPADGVRHDIDATDYAPLPDADGGQPPTGPFRRDGYPEGYDPTDPGRPEGMQGRGGAPHSPPEPRPPGGERRGNEKGGHAPPDDDGS